MITPTIGRIVLFQPEPDGIDQAAIITSVQATGTVNLSVFSPTGYPYPQVSIPFRQPEDEPIASGPSCHWMDYQVTEAARAAERGKQVAAKSTGRRRTG